MTIDQIILRELAHKVLQVRCELKQRTADELNTALIRNATDVSATGRVVRELLLQAINSKSAAARAR